MWGSPQGCQEKLKSSLTGGGCRPVVAVCGRRATQTGTVHAQHSSSKSPVLGYTQLLDSLWHPFHTPLNEACAAQRIRHPA
jgi:hypothetical protein